MRLRLLLVAFLLLCWPMHGVFAAATAATPKVCTKSWKQVFETTISGMNASGAVTQGSVPELVDFLAQGCEFRLSYRYSKKVGTRTYWYSKGYVCEDAVADKKNDDAYFFCYSPVFGKGLAMRAEIVEFTKKASTGVGTSAFWDNERSINALSDLLPLNTTATFKISARSAPSYH